MIFTREQLMQMVKRNPENADIFDLTFSYKHLLDERDTLKRRLAEERATNSELKEIVWNKK